MRSIRKSWKRWGEAMKELLKKWNSPQVIRILLVGLLGIFLILLSVPGLFSSGENEGGTKSEKAFSKDSDTEESVEEQFEEALRMVDGIEDVEVVVSWSEDTLYGTKHEREAKGILVVVKGRDDIAIKEEIINAAEVLFGLPVHKIKVMKKKG